LSVFFIEYLQHRILDKIFSFWHSKNTFFN